MFLSDRDSSEDYVVHTVDTTNFGELLFGDSFSHQSPLAGSDMIGGGCGQYVDTSDLARTLGIESIWSQRKPDPNEPPTRIVNVHTVKPDEAVLRILRQRTALEAGVDYEDYDAPDETRSNMFQHADIHKATKNNKRSATVLESGADATQDDNKSPEVEIIKRKKRRKRKTLKRPQYRLAMIDRTNACLDKLSQLGENFVQFYLGNDPLLRSKSSPEFKDFETSFAYVMSSQKFSCLNGKRVLTIHETVPIVYKGMTFYNCNILDKILKNETKSHFRQMKRYFSDPYVMETMEEKYGKELMSSMDKLFPIATIPCYGTSKGGRTNIRNRAITSAFGLFFLVEWISRVRDYKPKAHILRQYLKYLDVEFGAYKGALQKEPYTHELYKLGLGYEEGDDLQVIYRDFCAKQFIEMRDGRHYDKTAIHGYDLVAKHHLSSITTTTTTTTTSTESQENNSQSSGSDGDNESEGDVVEIDKSQSSSGTNNGNNNNKGSTSPTRRITLRASNWHKRPPNRVEPFTFPMAWENDNGKIFTYTIIPFFDEIRLDKKSIGGIASYLVHEDEDKDIYMPHNRKITEYFNQTTFGLYSPSAFMASTEIKEHMARQGESMKEQDLVDCIERGVDLTEFPQKKQMSTMHKIWKLALKNMTKRKRSVKNSEQKSKRTCFLHIPCQKRNLRNRNISADIISEKGVKGITSKSCKGIPLFGERKKNVMIAIRQYTYDWPEEIVFFSKYIKDKSTLPTEEEKSHREVVPFWVITFFALTMTEYEKKANGSPLMLCHKIYESMTEWYEKNKEDLANIYTSEQLNAFISGTRMFQYSFIAVEEMASNMTAPIAPNLSPEHVLNIFIGMNDRLKEERDTLLVYLLDTLLPLIHKYGLDEEACSNMGLNVADTIVSLLKYANVAFSGDKERYYRQMMDEQLKLTCEKSQPI